MTLPALVLADKTGCINSKDITGGVALGIIGTDAVIVITAVVLAILSFTKVLHFPPAANYSLLGGAALILSTYGLIFVLG